MRQDGAAPIALNVGPLRPHYTEAKHQEMNANVFQALPWIFWENHVYHVLLGFIKTIQTLGIV